MGDQRFRIGRENFSVSAMNGNERYLSMPFARVKPPVVNKIDGRARILRPLRQTVMQTSTTHPNQATPSTSNVSSSSESRQSSSMHHSQSMPVLQSRASNSGAKPSTASQNQTASGRSTLTFPSNTTERNLLPLLTWIEMMRQKMEKMRQKSKKALSESMRDHSTMEDLSRAREVFVEMANIYNELNRTSQIKCRMNAVFDKRAIYKATEAAINSAGHKNVKNIPMFDKMQEAMDKRNAIEKNIAAVADNFRQSSVIPRISRFTAPPPIKFSKHVEDSNKGLLMAMEEVMNKVRGDPMSWRFRRISHPFFRNSKCLIEVHYCARRPSGEKDFVPHMKAVIVLKYGILEDLMIGGEDEELYDQERILESKRQVYNEFTKSAKEIILCSSVTKFTSSANFTACNNYIQSYVNCFSTKCFYCKKHLRQLMPPTVVTREVSPIIAHKLCINTQVP